MNRIANRLLLTTLLIIITKFNLCLLKVGSRLSALRPRRYLIMLNHNVTIPFSIHFSKDYFDVSFTNLTLKDIRYQKISRRVTTTSWMENMMTAVIWKPM